MLRNMVGNEHILEQLCMAKWWVGMCLIWKSVISDLSAVNLACVVWAHGMGGVAKLSETHLQQLLLES